MHNEKIDQPGDNCHDLLRIVMPGASIALIVPDNARDNPERQQYEADAQRSITDLVTGVECWEPLECCAEMFRLQLMLLDQIHYSADERHDECSIGEYDKRDMRRKDDLRDRIRGDCSLENRW